jgi:hypothetical protein
VLFIDGGHGKVAVMGKWRSWACIPYLEVALQSMGQKSRSKSTSKRAVDMGTTEGF